MSVVLAACGTPPGVSPSAASGGGSTPPSASVAPSDSPSAAPSPTPDPDAPPALALEPLVEDLDDPIGITAMPDGGLLVNERPGRVLAVDPASGATSVVLDLTDRIRSDDLERGLLGLALHPSWPETARAFVHYTGSEGETVLAEFTVGDEPLPPVLEPSSERILLRVDQPYPNHNGGQLAFGPDGYLYLGLGDGGSGGDPQGHGQDPRTLLGSILRLDVDPAAADATYAIPADNPFAGDTAGLPEIYLIGLRNPWRFSFDRETGDLWIADVGQEASEEINRLAAGDAAGANLGWNVMEGSQCYAEPDCDPGAFVAPIAEYGHDAGCSVTGGYVYRGDDIPGLDGWYVFGDFCSGTIFGVPADATEGTDPRVLLETDLAISAFGEGADGELYVADLEGGTVSRIVAGG